MSTSETTDESLSSPIHISTETEFDRLIETEDRLLADFYADWCGPCQMMEPMIDELAAESDEAVIKIDIESLPQIAARFGVSSIPTIISFEAGESVQRFVGITDRETIRRALD